MGERRGARPRNHRPDRRRACIVKHGYWPDPRIEREATALVEAGWQVDLLVLRKPGESAVERLAGMTVYRLPIGHRRGSLVHYFKEYLGSFALASVVLTTLHVRRRYGLIVVYNQPDFYIWCTLVARLLGARTVFSAVEPTPEIFETKFAGRRGLVYWGVRLFERLGMTYAHRTIVVSSLQRDRLVSRGIPGDKLDIVLNAADDRVFTLSERRPRRPDAPFTMITQGAVEPHYGHELAIRAVARLRHLDPPIRYQILGEGTAVPALRRLAFELGVADRVELAGFVPFAELLDRLRSADLGVVPVRRNGWSELVHTNKMFELMALGKPVLASSVAPVTTYFGDSPGLLLFEPDNVDSLVERLGAAHRDRDQLVERGRAARVLYEEYAWDGQKTLYLDAVERAMGVGA